MRFVLLFGMIFIFAISASVLSDHLQVLRPGEFSEFRRVEVKDIESNQRELKPFLSSHSALSGQLDTLSWRTLPEPTYIYGFWFFGDSAAVWFNPVAVCSLKAIRIHNIDFVGNTIIEVRKARYDGHIVTEDSIDVFGWIGGHVGGEWVPGYVMGHSPLGELICKRFPMTLTEEMGHSWIEVPANILGEPHIEGDPFFISIGFYRLEGLGLGAEREGTIPYHFFKYFADGFGPDGIHTGWFLLSFSLWVEVVVKYYTNIPPEINKMTHLAYTYSPGPFLVQAHIADKDYEDPERAGIASAHLHWNVNGIEDSTVMDGPREGGSFTGLIPELAPDDTVSYYISATDELGLRSTSAPFLFARLRPEKPEADILLVHSPLLLYAYDEFYTHVLDSLSFTYETWDLQKRHGIDESVLEYGWSTVFFAGIFGSNETTVPTREYSGNLWANFLDSGTNEYPVNFLHVHRWYFILNDEPDEPSFGQGDFAYDYLGLLSALEPWSAVDQYLYGVEGDPISSDFVHDPIEGIQDVYNWVGYTEARDGAVDIFFNETGRGSGVRYNGGNFKTIFLPWSLEDQVEDVGGGEEPKACVYTLLQYVLKWFGTQQELVRGDVNGNGLINVLDVLLGANILLGLHDPTQSEYTRADCNGDRQIDVTDLIGIVNVILGIDTCPP